MKIKKAKKVEKAEDSPDMPNLIETEMDDGTIWFMPENPDTWHRELLQQFLDDGGEIVE
jgi:hypothetical protein